MILKPLFSALIVWLVSMSLLAPAYGETDPKEQLRKGEILVTSKKRKEFPRPGVKAVGVIKAPMERIWPLIDKCGNYTETMQRVLKSVELSREGNIVVCEITIDLPFPLDDIKAKTRAVHTIKPQKLYKRAWKLIDGDYEYNEGSWTLVPFGGSMTETLVVYETQVEPKSMIPNSIRSLAQKQTIPALFEHLRDQVK